MLPGIVWELAVELVFDCFCACNRFPRAWANPLAIQLKFSAGELLREIRRLSNSSSHETRPAVNRLYDLAQLLQASRGLGFLDVTNFTALDREAQALQRLLH